MHFVVLSSLHLVLATDLQYAYIQEIKHSICSSCVLQSSAGQLHRQLTGEAAFEAAYLRHRLTNHLEMLGPLDLQVRC